MLVDDNLKNVLILTIALFTAVKAAEANPIVQHFLMLTHCFAAN